MQPDPRNAKELIARKEQLIELARQKGIDYSSALSKAPSDTVAQIGVLARLLRIDASIALVPSLPLPS
jgi:hypothetical protein